MRYGQPERMAWIKARDERMTKFNGSASERAAEAKSSQTFAVGDKVRLAVHMIPSPVDKDAVQTVMHVRQFEGEGWIYTDQMDGFWRPDFFELVESPGKPAFQVGDKVRVIGCLPELSVDLSGKRGTVRGVDMPHRDNDMTIDVAIDSDTNYSVFAFAPSELELAEEDATPFGLLEEILTNGPKLSDEEVRVIDPETGGQKGKKPEEYALIPVGPLAEVARVYGFGASKYTDRNWEKGVAWNLSYSALQRHVNAFWSGEDNDPESGLSHLSHAVFHCFAMMEYSKTHPEKDNRQKGNSNA